MKAIRLRRGEPIPPFLDPPEEIPVLNTPLAACQEAVLAEVGIALVEDPPADEPYLIFSDRTWFTRRALDAMIAAGPGRMKIDDGGWWTANGALQELAEPGVMELGLVPAGGAPSLEALSPVVVSLGLRDVDPPELHPAMRHAMRPMRLGGAMVHQLNHWTHILRVNQLALAARAESARLDWEESGWLARIGFVLRLLLRVRSIRRERILDALSERRGKSEIHPTAVVELCVIGEGVKIGPHAVVRASVLGDGATVEEHATVNFSSLGAGATVGRYGMLNLSVLYPGAMTSSGGGFQASLFGRDAFVAWGATILDLSFGRSIPVSHRGERADSEQHFLGAAIGHRARIGNGVRLTYGLDVPNDAFLVAPADDLIRDTTAVEPGAPCRAVDGRAEPVRR
jgi:acetyltransferase-like isoleucine patch superfamily enzyme